MVSKLIRLPIYGTFMVLVVSLFVGRWMGPELDRRRLRASGLAPVVCIQADDRREVMLLDGRRGALTSMPLPEGHRLDVAALSPWQDGLGRGEVTGLWVATAGEGNTRVREAFGLARIRFPDGEILNRVTTDVLPGGPPCWSGAFGDEIVYASGTGRLYRFAFSGSSDPRSPDGCDVEPTELGWDIEPPGAISDLTRPLGTGCEGLYLASVRREHGGLGTKFGCSEIWWLQLDPPAKRVVAAGRLSESSSGLEVRCERYPALGRGTDGRPYLAYLRKEPGGSEWSLRVAALCLTPGSTVPVETRGPARTLAERCAGSPPSFDAASGRIAYLIARGGSEFRVGRVSCE